MISPCEEAGVVTLRWLSVVEADPSSVELEAPFSGVYPFGFADPLMPFVFGRCVVC